jgi:preprotein translocase subunit SecD
MKITIIACAFSLLTFATFALRLAEGGPLKEGPQPNGRQAAKPEVTHARSLEIAVLANERLHKDIIRQAQASRDAELRRDGKLIAAWREVGWDETGQKGVQKQKPIFADRSTETVQREVDRNGQRVRELLVVYPPPERRVTGEYLARVFKTYDRNGNTAVGFEFNKQGAALFGQLTTEYAPQPDGFRSRLTVMIDDQIHSAPGVNEPIRGGSGIIEGHFTTVELDELSKVLSHGVLQNDVNSKLPSAAKALQKK